jgi:RNA polymerase sigma-70 factor (ECF subfamily)
MEKASCSDADLVVQACGGETDAFALLVSRYKDRIYNAAVHLVGATEDAEDIAQDVFLKAFHGLKGFRRRAKFSTWLYGIMLNCVRSHWRSKGRRKAFVSLGGGDGEDGSMPDPPSDQEGPVASSVRKETIEMVRRAIEALDGELKEMVVLRDLEGFTYEEMSEMLGLPLGTVKSRLFRARAVLKEEIGPVLAGGL